LAEAKPLYERVADLASGGKPAIRARAALATIESEDGAIVSDPLDTDWGVAERIGREVLQIAKEYRKAAYPYDVPEATDKDKELYRSYALRKLDACEMLVRRCADSNDLVPSALVDAAEIRAKLGERDRAIEEFTRAVNEYPDHSDAPFALGYSGYVHHKNMLDLREKGDSAGALKEAQIALDTFERCARTYPDTLSGTAYRDWIVCMRDEMKGMEGAKNDDSVSGKENDR